MMIINLKFKLFRKTNYLDNNCFLKRLLYLFNLVASFAGYTVHVKGEEEVLVELDATAALFDYFVKED